MNLMPIVYRHCLCLILAFCLIPMTIPLRAQKAAAAQQPAHGSAASSDPGWPREVKKDGARLVYYQPQIDEWKDYRELTGDMAVSLTPAGESQLWAWLHSHADHADLEKRTVVIRSIESPARASLQPTRPRPSARALLRQLFPTAGMTISLDRVLAGLQRSKTFGQARGRQDGSSPDFPSARSPAILLLVDGEPVRAPIEKTQIGVRGQYQLGCVLRQDRKEVLPLGR